VGRGEHESVVSSRLGIAFPIWRVPGRDPDVGHNAWDTIYAFWTEVEHIPAEQSIEEAKAYYERQS
jgi:hypothetical protein